MNNTNPRQSELLFFERDYFGVCVGMNIASPYRLHRQRGKHKSVIRTATLQNSDKGTLREISECLTVYLHKSFIFDIMIIR